MWERIKAALKVLWTREAPAVQHVGGQLQDLAGKAETAVDAKIPSSVRGVRVPRVRYLLALALLAIFAGLYWRYWHNRPASSPLTPAATQGNASGVFVAPPLPRIDFAPATPSAIRPKTRKVKDLPQKEQDVAPVVPPAMAMEVQDADGKVPPPELAAASTVPAHRAPTEVRTYLMPDGSFSTTLLPKKEGFWGWKTKVLELEAGYGVGGKQIDAQARWMPLRLGDVHVGTQVETWTDSDGSVKGAASIRVRWEPFR